MLFFFMNDHNVIYVLNMDVLFEQYQHSSVAETPVKYEPESKDLLFIFGLGRPVLSREANKWLFSNPHSG